MKQSELAFDKASWTEEAFDRKALADRALAMHGRNFNCAQCVACTLAPFVGADEDFVFRATEALGGGMGGFTETCGAISGGEVIIGLACSNGSDNPTSKQDTYAWAHKLVDNFRARVGSTVCEEIKNVEGGAPLRGCDLCILDSLEMTIDILIQIGKEA
ncbi:C-GCAxxG-C-C family protein [uncultured Slackia sp.]|uniref:C-GCAxxG-C-C family protein n=1 Tax=Slackia sp. TaxID=2049041 RepID=UPI00280B32C9|nr:C-GCAxxG-C-C family protein [uncultured Slackia sp.]